MTIRELPCSEAVKAKRHIHAHDGKSATLESRPCEVMRVEGQLVQPVELGIPKTRQSRQSVPRINHDITVAFTVERYRCAPDRSSTLLKVRQYSFQLSTTAAA